MRTKKLSLLACLLLMVLCTYAQGNYFDIDSFHVLQTDMDARIQAPVEDQNGEKCALIKVTSNVKGIVFESPAMGIVKQEVVRGEIWVYVPAQSRMVSIFHDDYAPFRNYAYPVRIESATVYEMKITGHRDVEPLAENSNAQMLTLNVQPAAASLYIDDEEMPTENGLFTAMMPKGSHTYRIEAKDYEPVSGTIELADQQWVRSIRLKEKFGFLSVISYPEDSVNVYINDKLVGVTPFRSDNLDPKQYSVRLEKNLFFPMDTTTVVNTGGETTELVFHMTSTIKPKEQRKTFVMLDAAFGGSQTSLGAMVGMVGKGGGYLHLRTDFRSAPTDGVCNDERVIDGDMTPSYFSGATKKSRFSITGGYVHRFTLNNPFKHGGMGGIYGYVGAGYGSRTLAWETSDGRWMENKDHSASGIAAELGGICRMGTLAFSLGYQTVSFKYHEVSLGIGVFF